MAVALTVGDVAAFLEAWAPPRIAWDRDNVGLQIGSFSRRVRGILVSLDVTEGVIREAVRKRSSLLVSHHPLLFRPPPTLVTGSSITDTITLAVRNEIDVFSVHTNLDFTRGGVSFALAERLGLRETDFLSKTYSSKRKIVTFVPPDHLDMVFGAMSRAGAGTIGNYDHCSFTTGGTATFRGNSASSPVAGRKGRVEHVKEMRLEMTADEWQVPRILAAMRASHPYEEVAYDVLRMENVSDEFGMGVIGNLKRPLRVPSFLQMVKRNLRLPSARYTRGSGNTVRRVAVCGGSGSDLLHTALHQGADAFVTADVKYHTFHEASGRMLLVDAGHHETEFPVTTTVAAFLRTRLAAGGQRIRVHVARTSTNPVTYV